MLGSNNKRSFGDRLMWICVVAICSPGCLSFGGRLEGLKSCDLIERLMKSAETSDLKEKAGDIINIIKDKNSLCRGLAAQLAMGLKGTEHYQEVENSIIEMLMGEKLEEPTLVTLLGLLVDLECPLDLKHNIINRYYSTKYSPASYMALTAGVQLFPREKSIKEDYSDLVLGSRRIDERDLLRGIDIILSSFDQEEILLMVEHRLIGIINEIPLGTKVDIFTSVLKNEGKLRPYTIKFIYEIIKKELNPNNASEDFIREFNMEYDRYKDSR